MYKLQNKYNAKYIKYLVYFTEDRDFHFSTTDKDTQFFFRTSASKSSPKQFWTVNLSHHSVRQSNTAYEIIQLKAQSLYPSKTIIVLCRSIYTIFRH